MVSPVAPAHLVRCSEARKKQANTSNCREEVDWDKSKPTNGMPGSVILPNQGEIGCTTFFLLPQKVGVLKATKMINRDYNAIFLLRCCMVLI